MTDAAPEDLQRELDAIAAEAAAMRAEPTTEGADRAAMLAEVAASGHVVERFLLDVFEAIKQVCVAGLAYPDPELADELQRLAERGRQVRVAGAVERLRSLRAWIRAVSAERRVDARHRLAAGAWRETQRLLAWYRVFRMEHDILMVQARLAASSQAVTGASRERDRATRSLTAWPLGAELDAGGRLLIFAVALDGRGERVILRDQVTEFDRQDPLHHPAISRLFQDSIRLDAVLRSALRLEDHPVVERADALLFRPAFRQIPKALPVAHDFVPPALPRLQLDATSGRWRRTGPSLVDVTLSREPVSGRARATLPDGSDAPFAASPTLRYNLTMRLARGGGEVVTMTLAVLPRDDELLVLHHTTELDERIFPTLDPTAFALSSKRVLERIESEAARLVEPEDVMHGLFARVTAGIHRARYAPVDADALRDALDLAPVSGVEAAWRRGVALYLLGRSFEASSVEGLVRDVASLAARAEGSPVDTDVLARVLGRRNASPGEMREVGGWTFYRAVWLALSCASPESLREPLEALYVARYRGASVTSAVGEVCACALLRAFVEDGGVTSEGEGDDEDDAEGEVEAKVAPGALEFLVAHLEDLLPGRARDVAQAEREGRALPELIEVFALADTLAWLSGRDRRASPVLGLGVPVERLMQRCADVLCAWCSRPEGAVDVDALRALGDALLAAAGGACPMLLGD